MERVDFLDNLKLFLEEQGFVTRCENKYIKEKTAVVQTGNIIINGQRMTQTSNIVSELEIIIEGCGSISDNKNSEEFELITLKFNRNGDYGELSESFEYTDVGLNRFKNYCLNFFS